MKYKVVDYLENIIKFDKKHTQVIKGLAILFMVLHHVGSLYYNQIDLNWYARNSRDVPEMILLFFSTGGKVCVSLFTIMSGFGLAKSYGRYSQKRSSVGGDVRFILSHLIQFYSIYWIAFLLRLGMQCYTPDRFQQVFGSDSAAVLRFIAGFFGLSTLFNLRGLCDDCNRGGPVGRPLVYSDHARRYGIVLPDVLCHGNNIGADRFAG